MSWLDRYFVSRNYTSVQDSGTDVAPQPTLNFIGFDVENDANNNRTNISASGSSGGAFVGYEAIAMADADHTVTTEEAANAILDCTGVMTGDHSLVFDPPSASTSQVHVIKNSTTGGYNISVEVSGQATVIEVSPGDSLLLEIRPAGVFNAVTGI